ncbi:hypothetical protein Q4512_16370 [Oceanihabitans sp. 2_MG-2023]|uniref:hypothetical protein n=1 Tax=Oceanihabitans sp. 2_MG-2023 TaxID=3062661 RepID=UPI0026E3BE4C|nr:hypothetical protein [Oceanihabitans sp. 2_MG-2023]MDO6598496.1 hypothetical protein [Oceanihabitans sp. 2_MG-2023]
MKKDIEIGNWVNSYSKGIYRVEKIFDRFYDESSALIPENRKIGDNQKSIVLTKRFLNSKFNKSLSYESCDESFISHLTKKQLTELNKVISEKPQLISELNEYEIPTLKTIYNSDLQIDNETDLQQVNKLIEFIKNGKSFLEIKAEMERLDILRLKPKHFGNYKLQLLNFNEEYINKRKIWRDAELNKN